ncbi:MAG: hypothetical protein OSB69_23350, partial [Alphaproteobacteria bacterium]|nr:hypothetical protein [Alphaproteobacteria bacterium]
RPAECANVRTRLIRSGSARSSVCFLEDSWLHGATGVFRPVAKSSDTFQLLCDARRISGTVPWLTRAVREPEEPAMKEPFAHNMMPRAASDERARQNFVAGLKMHMEDNVYPSDRKVGVTRVLPRFKAEHGRAPNSRVEWRRAMEADPLTSLTLTSSVPKDAS